MLYVILTYQDPGMSMRGVISLMLLLVSTCAWPRAVGYTWEEWGHGTLERTVSSREKVGGGGEEGGGKRRRRNQKGEEKPSNKPNLKAGEEQIES